MADPLREAVAALVEQWQRDPGVSFDAWRTLRDLLAAHPEPEPAGCPACGGSGLRLNASGYREPCEGCDPVPAEPPVPEGAVRVRIAVAVDADGEWYAVGEHRRRALGGAVRTARRGRLNALQADSERKGKPFTLL